MEEEKTDEKGNDKMKNRSDTIKDEKNESKKGSCEKKQELKRKNTVRKKK